MLLAACDGKFIKRNVTNNCSSEGWTLTAIHYGDSRVIVIPLSEVVAGAEFRFALLPQLKGTGATNFENATVKVRGKRSPEDDWFTEIDGKASDKTIFTCVKNTLTPGDSVEYVVEIGFTREPNPRATLDPRATVIIKPN
jgi:hypothetical protein